MEANCNSNREGKDYFDADLWHFASELHNKDSYQKKFLKANFLNIKLLIERVFNDSLQSIHENAYYNNLLEKLYFREINFELAGSIANDTALLHSDLIVFVILNSTPILNTHSLTEPSRIIFSDLHDEVFQTLCQVSIDAMNQIITCDNVKVLFDMKEQLGNPLVWTFTSKIKNNMCKFDIVIALKSVTNHYILGEDPRQLVNVNLLSFATIDNYDKLYKGLLQMIVCLKLIGDKHWNDTHSEYQDHIKSCLWEALAVQVADEKREKWNQEHFITLWQSCWLKFIELLVDESAVLPALNSHDNNLHLSFPSSIRNQLLTWCQYYAHLDAPSLLDLFSSFVKYKQYYETKR